MVSSATGLAGLTVADDQFAWPRPIWVSASIALRPRIGSLTDYARMRELDVDAHALVGIESAPCSRSGLPSGIDDAGRAGLLADAYRDWRGCA